MSDTYALTICVESYEYDGEFYLVGEGHSTPRDVFQHVVADHIRTINRTRHIEQYLLDVLKAGENVSRTEFEEVDAEVECGMYVDAYYQQFSFWVDDRMFEIEGPNIDSEIESIAEDLRSETHPEG